MRKTFCVDGLFCCEEGTGLPLVTLHPGPGWDHEIFHPWLDPLAGELRLVHHDYRGNGRSTRPQHWADLGPAQIVADVDTLRRALGLEELVLFGHSIGAYLALEYARTHPHRVLGLILCAGAPAMDFVEEANRAVSERATAEQAQALQRIFTAREPDDEWLREAVRTALPLYLTQPVAELEACVVERVHFSAQAWVAFRDRHLFTYSCLHWLPEITAPALILAGEKDLTAPLAPTAHRMASLMPRAQLHVFQDSGHVPFAEKPHEFLAVVRGWLAQLRGE